MSKALFVRALPVLALTLGACQSTTENSTPAFVSSPSSTTRAAVTGDGQMGVGAQAPNFSLTDHEGNRVSLSDFAGDIVVLEWFNPKCEFTRNSHIDGTLKRISDEFNGQGVQFLAINSTAPGNIGFSPDYGAAMCNQWDMEYPLLSDPNGEASSAFRVSVAPTVCVIDGEGTIRYQGAVDNSPNQNGFGAKRFKDFVRNAIVAIQEGRNFNKTWAKPYGCPIETQDRTSH
ncbi:MAG: redoxin domain-containing protein [Planctomycetota bacterium]